MATKLFSIKQGSYPDNAKTPFLNAKLGQQIKLYKTQLTNKSGGAIDLGLLRGLGPSGYKVYSLASGAATDVTAQLQAGSDTPIFDTANNDGFIVESKEVFSLIGFNISQADSGSPVYAFQYWNGSSWTSLTPLPALPSSFATGTQLVFFAVPIDWVQGGSGATGADSSKYHIRGIATTAPGQIVNANAIWVGQLLDYAYQVANNLSATFETAYPDATMDPTTFEAQDYVLPYFGGTANKSNLVQVKYLINY